MTDYCTLWPEGWWSHCCKLHDEAYATQMDKAEADHALFNCVASSGSYGSLLVALIMFAGVTVFGRVFYKRNRDV